MNLASTAFTTVDVSLRVLLRLPSGILFRKKNEPLVVSLTLNLFVQIPLK